MVPSSRGSTVTIGAFVPAPVTRTLSPVMRVTVLGVPFAPWAADDPTIGRGAAAESWPKAAVAATMATVAAPRVLRQMGRMLVLRKVARKPAVRVTLREGDAAVDHSRP